MTVEHVVWLLSALAFLDVVLTRARLSARPDAAGRVRISQTVINAHTGFGLAALLVWVCYLLVLGGPLNLFVGYVALVLWAVTGLVGLLICSRWLPSRSGRRVADRAGRGTGPWLSLLVHVGLVLVVAFFAWGTLTDSI